DVSMEAEVVGLLAPSCANKVSHGCDLAPILGHPGDLPDVLKYNVVDEVIALLPGEGCDLQSIAASCATRGLIMRMLVERPPGKTRWCVNDCGDGSLFLSLVSVPQDALRLFVK